ncbi:sn-glycerol-3-phosphate ABC transporter ATP-binding protein UgpC [Gemmobacter sp.]|uniref:sn-glycerol-3-phosphate ABC transporter ATP-binding protein UgpC n=1 Tax=Gemmobacter sp. TaxID=1898957 RepID=UPI002AFFDDD9|nr:sn-glycerol-3-phosphate ABC transporter ATP-binding protein UgpC [Gemmobacter sp.]
MARIQIGALRKAYPGARADTLHSVDLTIEDGEMAVLVGPSGCGKSTLLRMIAGLETVTGGEIRIGDRVVNQLEPAERDIAMVFQNYALYPHMTVRGNLEYGLKNRRTPRAEIDARVAEAARVLEIAPFLDRKPQALSGGQRQRVAMGRAIVRKPQVFLFDEPLSNLDARLRGQMRVEIRRLQRRFATTAIHVTHDQLEAMTMADKLVVMNAGRIEQVGSPMDLFEAPRSLFVAGFIGAPGMNLLPVEDLRGAGADLAGLPGNAAVIGIRPEHLAPQAMGGIALSVTVEAVELVGSETLVHLGTPGLSAPLVLRHPGVALLTPGDRLRVALPTGRLHCFDAHGLRIGTPALRPSPQIRA